MNEDQEQEVRDAYREREERDYDTLYQQAEQMEQWQSFNYSLNDY